jgi:hypothetical protein
MGFTEVASLDADVTVALGKINKATGKPYPKQAEGYYLGNRKVNNTRGESTLHFLQTADGNLGVWGTTDLDRKLGQVDAGTMVRITSTGKKATPNGDMYTYKVEADNDNTIEVNVNADDASFDEAGDAEGNGFDANAYVSAGQQASTSKAKQVEELLKNRSRKN